MFCPNCGTQNPETAQTCSKCAFNLKGAAAPKFKGTMLMMNQPGAAGAAPAPPRPAGVPTPAPAPAPGIPSAGPSKLKGTMVGVAPPMPGAAPAPPPFGAPPAQSPGFGTPPPSPAEPYPQQAGQFQPPGQGPANPLAGTVAAENAGAFGGGFGAAPPAQDPYASGGAQGPGVFPPPQQGYGGQPQQAYGGQPQQQQYGGQMQQGAQNFGNAAAGAFGQAGDAAGQAYGGMAQGAGFGGGPMQQQQQQYGGGPPPGGFGGGFGGPGGPMGPGAGGQINTTQPLIFAIVSVFCCWPAAIVAIIFALQAKKLAEQGQIDAAMAKAKTSKLISFIAIGLGLVAIILNIVIRIVR